MKDIKVSTNGIALILKFETWQHKSYDDGYGYYTIGVGHRRTNTKKNTTISSETVWRLFVEDIKAVEAVIDSAVTVTLTDGQFDALVSFVFNVGTTAFRKSTLLRLLNSGDYSGAAKQFDRWVLVDGKRSKGLITRRQYERAMFENVDFLIS